MICQFLFFSGLDDRRIVEANGESEVIRRRRIFADGSTPTDERRRISVDDERSDERRNFVSGLHGRDEGEHLLLLKRTSRLLFASTFCRFFLK